MNAPDLASLQRQFSRALHYGTYTLPVADGVAETDALLQVYRNNFVMTLTEYLEIVYPVVHALVGEECFNAVARHHVLNVPMTDACANQYGDAFDCTIAALPNIIDAVPYIADIATFEWLIQRVSQLPVTTTTFSLSTLVNLVPDDFNRLTFHVSPSVRIMQSEFSIVSIWQAVTNNDVDALQTVDSMQPQAAMLKMGQHGIIVDTLSQEEVALIAACENHTLGDVEPTLLMNLANMVQHGVFHSFTLDHNV